MKTGPLWWRVSGRDADANGARAALNWSDTLLGVADGMFFADEEISSPYTPSRGTETCSVVEMMHSMRTAFEATADVQFWDRLEVLRTNRLK
jgi:hypothetical protein